MRTKKIDIKGWDTIELWAGTTKVAVVAWDRTKQVVTQVICGPMALGSDAPPVPCLDAEPGIIRALREEGL